ncbi:MAG: hypothetical protein ACI30I_08985 [Parabacteroides sp.]
MDLAKDRPESDVVLAGIVLTGIEIGSLDPVDPHPGQNYEWDDGAALTWDNGSAVLTE